MDNTVTVLGNRAWIVLMDGIPFWQDNRNVSNATRVNILYRQKINVSVVMLEDTVPFLETVPIVPEVGSRKLKSRLRASNALMVHLF